MMGFIKKYLLTTVLVVGAVAVVLTLYRDYIDNPWTRDGQVQAQVIQISPRVSGPIVSLPIVDNALVKRGDVLWKIDPRTYQAALDQAQAQLQASQQGLETSQALKNVADAQGALQ